MINTKFEELLDQAIELYLEKENKRFEEELKENEKYELPKRFEENMKKFFDSLREKANEAIDNEETAEEG